MAPTHRINTVLAPEERLWHPFFVRPKKDYINQEAGKSMEQNLFEMVQVNALFHSDEFFVCLVIQKQKKTAPRVPKLCYFNGRVP